MWLYRRLNYVLFLLALGTALPVFIIKPLRYQYTAPSAGERYDSTLAKRFTSTALLLDSIDRQFRNTPVTKDSVVYWHALSELVACRFYHAPSTYQFSQNWLLWGFGKIWRNLQFCIVPDHIMQSPSAWCHQQAIIMMECMRKKKIDYRAVCLPHHFSLEGFIAGQWRFFDTNKEPRFLGSHTASYEQLFRSGSLDDQYNIQVYGRLNHDAHLTVFGEINHYYGWRCAAFQMATRFLSNNLWLFFGLLLFARLYEKKDFFGSRKMLVVDQDERHRKQG